MFHYKSWKNIFFDLTLFTCYLKQEIKQEIKDNLSLWTKVNNSRQYTYQVILTIKTVKGKTKKTKHKNWIIVHIQQHWEKD